MFYISNGDTLSTRASRLLAMLVEQYQELEVERINLRDHTQWSGHEWDFVVYDEYSKYPAPRPVSITNRKPKPFYRQGERW